MRTRTYVRTRRREAKSSKGIGKEGRKRGDKTDTQRRGGGGSRRSERGGHENCQAKEEGSKEEEEESKVRREGGGDGIEYSTRKNAGGWVRGTVLYH